MYCLIIAMIVVVILGEYVIIDLYSRLIFDLKE